jgi:hypothetical protein
MSVKQSVEWELTGETEALWENPPQCHFVHHKSHITWPRLEPWPAINRLSYDTAPTRTTVLNTDGYIPMVRSRVLPCVSSEHCRSARWEVDQTPTRSEYEVMVSQVRMIQGGGPQPVLKHGPSKKLTKVEKLHIFYVKCYVNHEPLF